MIRLEGLTKVYADGTRAVHELDLHIADGEFVVFVGPSGCGKTTSLRMINRMIEPTSGTIWIDDVDTSTGSSSADATVSAEKMSMRMPMTSISQSSTSPRKKGRRRTRLW